ncbi:helix-turn-helix transcriptional regulator, partial [Streptomyces sp. NPDC048269]|uniref:helix-turn-helix domain-containing protein n=1 Tax=Streptomyces sp. NPDC048269 TaxID=3155753 RepID=UPI0034439EDA
MTQSVETNSELSLPSPKERRRLREAADLTYEQVAAAVGVTVTTVRSWEAGRTEPRGRKREAYARFLTDLSEPPRAETPAPADPDPPSPVADANDPAPGTAVAEAGQGLAEADAPVGHTPQGTGPHPPLPTADPAQEAIGAERPIAEAREGLVANDT